MSENRRKSASNRSCKSADYYWDRRSFEQHRLRSSALKQVREARATVNMQAPERRPHVSHDAKRLQMEQERQAQIARDNFILFKRLTDIMSGKLRHKYPLTQGKSKCIKIR